MVPAADDSGGLLHYLLEVLARLSWPADRQRAYLVELGVAPTVNELALEFDDALKPLLSLYGKVGIDEESGKMLVAIDAAFAEMGQNSDGLDSAWEWDSLDGDSRWAAIRRMAASVSARLRNGASSVVGDVT